MKQQQRWEGVRRTSKILSTAVFFSAPARTMANGSIAKEVGGVSASRFINVVLRTRRPMVPEPVPVPFGPARCALANEFGDNLTGESKADLGIGTSLDT